MHAFKTFLNIPLIDLLLVYMSKKCNKQGDPGISILYVPAIVKREYNLKRISAEPWKNNDL